jgi:S1-C subfamily serine protease
MLSPTFVGYSIYAQSSSKIDAPADNLRVIPMGSSADLVVGLKAMAIGNPFGLDRTLTTGVISGLDRPLETDDGRIIEKVIQTDASINPGNSGGPLLNKFGQIIGINSAIYSPSGGSVGIGFAIPIDIAKKLLPELIANGKVRKAFLGISTAPLTASLAQAFGVNTKEGVIVVEVEPNGPAAIAGLHGIQSENQIGDIITAIDDKPIKDYGDLARIVSDHRPGDKVKLAIIRQGSKQQITVALGDRPVEAVQQKRGWRDWLR